MKPIIRVEGLSKQYRIGTKQASYNTLRESFTSVVTAPFRHRRNRTDFTDHRPPATDHQPDTIWALKDVSFEVRPGEVVGIIGRNGAGKSTLLKILSRITEPSEGIVNIYGRVGSLLEVGTGFHPELTGRENIYLNGVIIGMKRGEVEKKFDEIVEFAEVEKFINTPVKYYSNGLYLRLAFAVAAHLNPEILIIDEVLAVGDASFQKKCLGKMDEVASHGRTVLLVSHNMAVIKNLCKDTIWIDQGRLVRFGGTGSIIDDYLANSVAGEGEFQPDFSDSQDSSAEVQLLRVSVNDRRGEVTKEVAIDSAFWLKIEYEVKQAIENVRLGYRLISNDGTIVFTSQDTDPNGEGTYREAGIYVSTCMIPGNFLNSGRYYITVACDQPMQKVIFFRENVMALTVHMIGGVGSAVMDGRLGIVRPSLSWDIYQLSHTDASL